MTCRSLLAAALLCACSFAQTGPTYAEKLGWKKGDRVLILHMDDAGMSYDSNLGVERVLEHLKDKDILAVQFGKYAIRFVTHLDVDAAQIGKVCSVLMKFKG